MRKDGPGISGISYNTPGINLLKEKINARFEPNNKAMFEFNNTVEEELKNKPTHNEQNLIMLPAYLKEQKRIKGEIKRLDEQIKYFKTNGNDAEATKLETQKELYKQQLNDVNNKITEEQAKVMDTKIGLTGSDTNSKDIEKIKNDDEAAMLEEARQETLEELKNTEEKNKIKNIPSDFGLSE